MNYFEQSQLIKEEILASSKIMNTLEEHVTNKHRGKLIGEGSSNEHYRIGKLSNGLWVATRESRGTKWVTWDNPNGSCGGEFKLRSLNEEIEKLEEYCQHAERRDELSDYIITSFCIGVKYHEDNNWRGLILIEDLTKGDTVNIKIRGDYGTIIGQKQKIFFDLSWDDPDNSKTKLTSDEIQGIKYFKPEHMISIK